MGFDLGFNLNVSQMLQDGINGVANAAKGVTGVADGILDNPVLNPMGAAIDMLGNAIGLPKEVTDIAKTAAGVATGNPVLIANGAVGLVNDLAQNPPNVTEFFDAKVSGHLTDQGGYVQGDVKTPYGNAMAYADSAGLVEGQWDGGEVGQAHAAVSANPFSVLGDLYSPSNFPGFCLDLFAGPLLKAFLHAPKPHHEHIHHHHHHHHHHGIGHGPNPTVPPGESVGSGPIETKPDPIGSKPGPSDDIKSILADPSLSLEDKIMLILMQIMDGLDDDILKTTADLDQARMDKAQKQDKAKKSKDGGSATDIQKSDTEMEKLQLKLQKLMEKRKQMFDLMSNMSNKFNEMSKTAIQNLARA